MTPADRTMSAFALMAMLSTTAWPHPAAAGPVPTAAVQVAGPATRPAATAPTLEATETGDYGPGVRRLPRAA